MDAKDKNQNLFSIIIISYNQERYIKDAILSAFNQDFDNFEIIISDDCSKDNTWDIINETIKLMVQNKKNNIILNRNKTNIGIARNYQKAISLANGDWIVASAGDDISKPNRLKVINEIITTRQNVYAIGTGFDLVNAKGNYISKNKTCIKNEITLPLYPGFSAAISRQTYSKFPEIKENLQSEDIIFTLRALELGEIILTNVSTVQHRIHSNNVTSKGTSLEAYQGKITNHINAIKTLEYYKLLELQNNRLIPIINNQIRKFEWNIEFYNFLIEYYKMSFLKKILNLHKINPPLKHQKLYTGLYKIKIFFESYSFLTFISGCTEDLISKIINVKNTITGKHKTSPITKTYKI